MDEEPEVLVSFDAHHDLGYHGWAQTRDLLEAGQYMCDMWLCGVMAKFPQLKVRILYPPWQTKKDLEWERKSIKRQLPSPMQKRVLADLFYDDASDGVSPVAKPPRGETFEVKALYICRSSAWTPPWLDEAFVEFVESAGEVTYLAAYNPFLESGQDIDPLQVRSDFRWAMAEEHAAQMKAVMRMTPEDFEQLRADDEKD
jgi:hypothetical protein